MARLILITGGARSGKSSFALEMAEHISDKKLFVATCPDIDDEMSDRVGRHKEERKGRGWKTREIEVHLSDLFCEDLHDFNVILVDCITLWVNNILHEYSNTNTVVDDILIKELCGEWLEKMRTFSGTVICVTNEVGLGIVPDNPLARAYRDLVGTCNQLIGQTADQVVLVSCGVPLFIKK